MSPIRNQSGELLDSELHDAERNDCLVILGHGVTGNKDRPLLFELAKALQQNGFPTLRISFSGNGDSEGTFEQSTISKEVQDLTAVIDQAGNGKKIAYIGHSMGGAVGALTAVRDERIKILISLAGMVHTAEFCDREFGEVTPDQGNMWDEEGCPLSQQYVDNMQAIDNTLDAAREIRIPWLLLHGTADDVVYPKDSHDLIAVLRGASELVEIEDAGHSFDEHHKEVAKYVCGWLNKYLG